MASSFNVSELLAYTDELSLDLISKAVLTTDLLDYVDLRPGFSAGSVTINLVDTTLPVVAADCGNYPTDGAEVAFTQVPVQISSLMSKATMCVEDLRSKYLGMFMSPGMGNDQVPFESVISDSYAKNLRKANEYYLINGNTDTGADGLKAIISGNANTQAGTPAAWDASQRNRPSSRPLRRYRRVS